MNLLQLPKTKLTVRCYTCGLIQKDGDVNTELLSQHIKSVHPHLFQKCKGQTYTEKDRSVDMTSSCNNEITESLAPKSDKGSEMEDTLKETDENDTALAKIKNQLFQRTVFRKPFFEIVSTCEQNYFGFNISSYLRFACLKKIRIDYLLGATLAMLSKNPRVIMHHI